MMPTHLPSRHLPLVTALTSVLLLAACGDPAPGEGVAHPPMQAPAPEIVPAQQALQTPDIPAIDPQTMQQAEIDKVLPPGPRCSFLYTAESRPILVATPAEGGAQGVIKLHGKLVRVQAPAGDLQALAGGGTFSAEGVTLEVAPEEQAVAAEPVPADLHFSLDAGLNVGYHGWYGCTGE